jgi:hypothetical protein
MYPSNLSFHSLKLSLCYQILPFSKNVRMANSVYEYFIARFPFSEAYFMYVIRQKLALLQSSVIGCHYILMCIPIARQRLGKNIPVKRTHATEGRPLLGNGPVHTPP